MKILLDCGHCLSGADTGAVGNGRKEQDCTREIGYKVKTKLEGLGHTIIIVSCDSSNSVSESLAYRVNKANASGGDLYISIHLNAGGGVGTEVYTNDAKRFTEAVNVLNAIVALGYTNRGIKDSGNLYVIRNTNMKSMLIECCFIDSSDMKKYNAEGIANAIVKGITGQTVVNKSVSYPNYLIKYNPTKYDANAKLIQQKLGITADGYFGNQTLIAVQSFQKANGLQPDGIIGQLTWNKLF